jgi:phosphoribosylformylglycinamidine (FGAM) synthase PurS component
MSVFDEFKEMLQSFNETATQSEAVASLEDHIKNVRTGSGDVITLALREAKPAFENAAEMCQKVLDSHSRSR